MFVNFRFESPCKCTGLCASSTDVDLLESTIAVIVVLDNEFEFPADVEVECWRDALVSADDEIVDTSVLIVIVLVVVFELDATVNKLKPSFVLICALLEVRDPDSNTPVVNFK